MKRWTTEMANEWYRDQPWPCGSRPGKPAPKLWQHDLFYGDHTPYDEREIALFRSCIGQGSKI